MERKKHNGFGPVVFFCFFPTPTHPRLSISPFFMSEVSEFFDNRFSWKSDDLATLCWTVTASHPSKSQAHQCQVVNAAEQSKKVKETLVVLQKLGVFSCFFSILVTGAVEADKVSNRMAMSKVVVAACYLPKVFSFHKDTKKHKQLHDIPNYFSSKGMNQMRYLAHTLDVSELPHNHRLDVKKDQTNVVNSGRFQLPTSFNWCSW